MDELKIFLEVNSNNEIISMTNLSNRDHNKQYIIVDGNYEEYFPLYEQEILKYKLVNNQIVLKSNQEKQSELDLIKKDKIRMQRNELLKQSDFALLNDVPFSEQQKNEILSYRQQLRDLMNNLDVNNFSFPQKPNCLK